MYKFKILSGALVENGQIYYAGSEVESERRLNEVFKNKFELIESVEPEVKIEEVPETKIEKTVQVKKPATRKRKSAKAVK